MPTSVKPRGVEVESLDDFDARIRRSPSLSGWFVQSLDLTERTDALLAADPTGAVFLGCRLTDRAERHLRQGGALLFPRLPDVPFDPYRGGLYAAAELFDTVASGGHYDDSLDGRVYAWTRAQTTPPSLPATLATSLHDHAIGDALTDLLAGLDRRQVVGVMGGHALERGTEEYCAAAELGAGLAAAGSIVVTGGGPGAMEAANLGARYVGRPDELRQALTALAAVPSFHPSIDAWARVALELLAAAPAGSATRTIGVPTWFYGHEPPNPFATDIAKFFSNALREDVLLQMCRGGIVYLPGAAGTVQELFQAVTGNYYATDAADIAPLVLVGRRHWTERVPAWPLLETLGRGRAMGAHVHLVDDLDEVVSALR